MLDKTLSRICISGLGRSFPGKDYKLGCRSAQCVSILSGLDVYDHVPEICPFIPLYFPFCSN